MTTTLYVIITYPQDVKAKKSNSLSSIAKCLLVSKKKRILRTRDKDFFEELRLTSLGNS